MEGEKSQRERTDEVAPAVSEGCSSSPSPPGVVVLHVGLQLGLVPSALLPVQPPPLLSILDLQSGLDGTLSLEYQLSKNEVPLTGQIKLFNSVQPRCAFVFTGHVKRTIEKSAMVY